jgi:hypothetical protein
MNTELRAITANAHIDTRHPNMLDWENALADGEGEFLSMAIFEEPGHEAASIAYLAKELAQLAELEKHVAAVMSLVTAEMQGFQHPLNEGFDLHHALSCFAAEETQHANMFFRYVREISGFDFRLADNLFAARLALYEGTDSPFVKLAALCGSAYVGESIITVFENRLVALDPAQKYFITRLLVQHGLDEARHIRTDHFVFSQVVPSLSAPERRRMQQICKATGDLNEELSRRFGEFTRMCFGFDYTTGNKGHEMQMKLGMAFSQGVFTPDGPRQVDETLSPENRAMIEAFTFSGQIHRGA